MNLDDLIYAEKINHFEADATGATALWPDTTHYRAECPASKRWFLIGGICKRDAAQTATVTIRDSSDNMILYLEFQGAATATFVYPSRSAGSLNWTIAHTGIVIDAGEYIEILFGGAQGAGAYASCIVLEVNV